MSNLPCTIKGYRAKYYERSFSTQTSDVTLKVPKLKGFTFEYAIIQRYQRRKCSVKESLVEMYFAGADIIIKGGKQYAVNIFFLRYVRQFARF